VQSKKRNEEFLEDAPLRPPQRIYENREKQMTKWVYSFGGVAEGDGAMRELLGGKGANFAKGPI
jgi:hypothetical protein